MIKEVLKEKDKLIISMEKNNTLGNLLRTAIWSVGGESGYDRGHPYIGDAKLVVYGEKPEEVLKKAITKLKIDLKELKAEVKQKIKAK
jgi:DNA-directed RNA polymerase subunit L